MSCHIEYRCDICAEPGHGRYQRYGIGVCVPKGWHSWGDKHLCSYACLIAHLKELELREGAVAKALRKATEPIDPSEVSS